jgi:hypothetical protein
LILTGAFASTSRGYVNITIKSFGNFFNYTTDGVLPVCDVKGVKPPGSFLLLFTAEVGTLFNLYIHIYCFLFVM